MNSSWSDHRYNTKNQNTCIKILNTICGEHCKSSWVQHIISEKHTASIFRVTKLVQVDAEVMWCKQMCQLYGLVWGNWPITVIDHRKKGQDCPKPMGVKNPKNDHKNKVYHWSLPLPAVTLYSHLQMVKAVFGILNPHWFRTVLSPFPTFCICDWPNSLKPSCITNTFSSTMSLQHPLELVWFPEVEAPLKHQYIWSLHTADTQKIVLSVHITFCAVEAYISF